MSLICHARNQLRPNLDNYNHLLSGACQSSGEEMYKMKEELKVTKKAHADAKLKINALQTELMKVADPLKQRFLFPLMHPNR